MRVTTVETVAVQVPFAERFPVSYETERETDHVFVRIHTADGRVGYGEGAALPWFTGEVADGMAAVVDQYLRPRVEGGSLDAADAAVVDFGRSFPNAPGACAAVEMALLDLRGKRAGIPVSDLLGPRRRDAVPKMCIIPAVDPEAAARTASAAADEGYRQFKTKADGDLEGDAARINAVLDAIPADATLRVDPNTAWVNAPTAERAVALVEHPEKLEYLEQPVPPERTAELRRIWDATGIRVFADEAAHGPADVAALGGDGLVAGCHLKLAKAGSLRRLEEMARVAGRYDLQVTVASAFGSSLDVAANLHVAAVAPALSRGCELCTDLVAADPVVDPLPVGPEMAVPDEPGLGVELDPELFE